MIIFQNVTKIYQRQGEPVVALEDVSFEVDEGDFISVTGKSGAGKTTLLKILLGAEKPTSGGVFFKGVDVCNVQEKHLCGIRRRIGAVFQDYKLIDSKTVAENLSYIMQLIGVSDSIVNRDVPKVLEIVGLEERTRHFPAELSGGERQRLAIARALIHRPEVIIADEPTGNLDPYNSFEIMKLLQKINSLGTTVMLLTHDKEIINKLKKRVITLERGRKISDDENGKYIL